MFYFCPIRSFKKGTFRRSEDFKNFKSSLRNAYEFIDALVSSRREQVCIE